MNRLQQKVKPQARGRMGVAGEGGKKNAHVLAEAGINLMHEKLDRKYCQKWGVFARAS